MARAIQKRALATRANLLGAAAGIAAQSGYAAMRVEDVAAQAGVAKGTVFAHFGDRDGLVEQLIADRIGAELARLAALHPPPPSVEGIVEALSPLHDIMTCEREVFDIVIRHSGALSVAAIGPMALGFGKYAHLVSKWVKAGLFRDDLNPDLTAEGVQAFAIQAMALDFCALHMAEGRDARLTRYLRAWLTPGKAHN